MYVNKYNRRKLNKGTYMTISDEELLIEGYGKLSTILFLLIDNEVFTKKFPEESRTIQEELNKQELVGEVIRNFFMKKEEDTESL